MPATNGPTSLSRSSGVNFALTNEATLSSALEGGEVLKTSERIENLVRQLSREEEKNAPGESGTGTSLPSKKMKRGTSCGASRSWLARSSSSQILNRASVPEKLCGPSSKRKPFSATDFITPPGRSLASSTR